jgi:hypothetical protein
VTPQNDARRDQAWACMRANLADIKRVAADGPRDRGDELLVKMVLHHTAAEVMAREAELLRAELESMTDPAP